MEVWRGADVEVWRGGEVCQVKIRKRGTAWIIVSAGGVNNGELALIELSSSSHRALIEFGAWPFKADVCSHSDVDLGLALTWAVDHTRDVPSADAVTKNVWS